MVRGMRRKCEICGFKMYTASYQERDPTPKLKKFGWYCLNCGNIVFTRDMEKKIKGFKPVPLLFNQNIALEKEKVQT